MQSFIEDRNGCKRFLSTLIGFMVNLISSFINIFTFPSTFPIDTRDAFFYQRL